MAVLLITAAVVSHVKLIPLDAILCVHNVFALVRKKKTQLCSSLNLRDVQRKWMAYRDANCQFYADPDGGILARVAANACLLRMTAERVEELGQMLSP